nr:glycosyltransferase family 1 protein [uncultured Agathobacter sp.]
MDNIQTKVLHYVSIMNRGGQETFIMNVFKAIDKKKVTFDFLCTINEKGAYDDDITGLGGKIFSLELGHYKIQLVDRLYALSKFLRTHNNEYKVFHIHTQHAMDGFLNAVVAKNAGIKKVIVHSHSTSTLYHPMLHMMFRPFLRNLHIYRFACSELAGQWLFGKHAKYKIIRNGIDINRFSYSTSVRKRVRLENDWQGNTVIGHVGSMTYPKNHEFIIDVFAEYVKKNPKAILVLVGDGPFKTKIETKIKSLKIEEKIRLMGSRSDIYNIDQGIDLFLFPSHYEGLPVVLVEAQCTGLKCLISDVITPEIDLTQNIYRMSLNEDIEAWVEMIDKIISTLDKRQSMSSAVQLAGFDIKNTAEELEKIYC